MLVFSNKFNSFHSIQQILLWISSKEKMMNYHKRIRRCIHVYCIHVYMYIDVLDKIIGESTYILKISLPVKLNSPQYRNAKSKRVNIYTPIERIKPLCYIKHSKKWGFSSCYTVCKRIYVEVLLKLLKTCQLLF